MKAYHKAKQAMRERTTTTTTADNEARKALTYGLKHLMWNENGQVAKSITVKAGRLTGELQDEMYATVHILYEEEINLWAKKDD